LIRRAILKLTRFEDLSREEAYEVMEEIMGRRASEAHVGAFLTALKMKGETVEEILGFVKAMMRFCHRINPEVGILVDTCGTGGDRFKTINISTIASFIVAGANVSVAKHGNRAVTGKCGSADVLERLGYNLNIEPKRVEEMIEQVGIGFIFAPVFHPAMKAVAKARKDIGIRTVYNILGPLTNPANPNVQLIGVYEGELIEKVAKALNLLGKRGVVVHGNGIDEVDISSETKAAFVEDGEIRLAKITPKDFGTDLGSIEELRALSIEDNAITFFNILYGLDETSRAKAVLINASLALHSSLQLDSLKEAMDLAKESLRSGKAYEKLKAMIKFSRGDLSFLERLEERYG
jgi:anthranilate phosphoribosyltransferase